MMGSMIPAFRSGLCACRNRGFFRLLDGKSPCPVCRPRAYKAAVRGAQFTGDPQAPQAKKTRWRGAGASNERIGGEGV